MSSLNQKNEYIHNLFRYIENNMSIELEGEFISSIGYVSRRKLYNDFYSINGHSVREYIRKRRLSNALALIKTSNLSIESIALQCGYSSHQALCRTIKQTIGITPSEYKNSDTFYFFPPCSDNPSQQIVVASETIPQTLCLHFYHSQIAGIESLAINKFMCLNPNYKGRIWGRNGKEKGNNFCYELYITDTDIDFENLKAYGFEMSYSMNKIESLFSTTTVRYDENKIISAWNYLYTEWLPGSMFEYTNEPYYEEYILKNNKPVKLKLYLPIKKRHNETTITLINNPELRFIAAKATGHNAEEIASEKVINHLETHYPYLINTLKEVYLQKIQNTYICGVMINAEMPNDKNENIIYINTNQNNYLLLECRVMGDYNRYSELLIAFAKDNGINIDEQGIFVIYDSTQDYFNPKMKMYCPVKICTQ